MDASPYVPTPPLFALAAVGYFPSFFVFVSLASAPPPPLALSFPLVHAQLSSAHVYLRLPEGGDIASIPAGVLEDCAQLVKHNSIEGNRTNGVVIVYTPWANLKKSGDMATGQVGFHSPKLVRRTRVEKRDNAIVNRLNKSKTEAFPDLAAEKETYLRGVARAAREVRICFEWWRGGGWVGWSVRRWVDGLGWWGGMWASAIGTRWGRALACLQPELEPIWAAVGGLRWWQGGSNDSSGSGVLPRSLSDRGPRAPRFLSASRSDD